MRVHDESRSNAVPQLSSSLDQDAKYLGQKQSILFKAF